MQAALIRASSHPCQRFWFWLGSEQLERMLVLGQQNRSAFGLPVWITASCSVLQPEALYLIAGQYDNQDSFDLMQKARDMSHRGVAGI